MNAGEAALLLLGGNEGAPAGTLARAEAMIGERSGAVLARSRSHWTEPWGFDDPRPFLNRALLVRTGLEPMALLEGLQAIERTLGRRRGPGARYGPRPIDIDILLLGNRVIGAPALAVPHPRLHERAFALEPAADIAPGWRHPLLDRTLLELADDLRRRP